MYIKLKQKELDLRASRAAIAKGVYKERAKQGYSIKIFAKMVGVSGSYIHTLRSGANGSLSCHLVARCCELLEVSEEYLYNLGKIED